MSKVKDWISCGNNCEKCPFSWEEKSSYEYDEWDAGCYIKGSDFDDKPCYLINPFRFLIGTMKKRKIHYYEGTQWDGIGEFYEKEEKLNSILTAAIKENLLKEGSSLCYTSLDGQKTEYANPAEIIKNDVWKIRESYDKELLPKPKTLKEEWNTLLKKTWFKFYKKTIGKIVPYIVG